MVPYLVWELVGGYLREQAGFGALIDEVNWYFAYRQLHGNATAVAPCSLASDV